MIDNKAFAGHFAVFANRWNSVYVDSADESRPGMALKCATKICYIKISIEVGNVYNLVIYQRSPSV